MLVGTNAVDRGPGILPAHDNLGTREMNAVGQCFAAVRPKVRERHMR
jgi:hypothetical protein